MSRSFPPEFVKNIKWERCERCKGEKNSQEKKRELEREIEAFININNEINKKIKPKQIEIKLCEMAHSKKLSEVLKKIKINFNDDLVYNDGVEPYMNNCLIENNIYELNEKNKAVFNKFKQQSKLGLYTSVEITHDKDQGYMVKVLGSIKKIP